MVYQFLYVVAIVILIYFLFVNLMYVMLLIAAIPDIFRKFNETLLGHIPWLTKAKVMPPISIVMPVYNEEENVVETVKSHFNINLEKFYVIVVNDGSTDKTLESLIKEFDCYEVAATVPEKIKVTTPVTKQYISRKHNHLIILDKEHSGKGDSLNAGVNACRTPLFVTADADTILEPDALSYLLFSMFSHPHNIVDGGAIYVSNGCKVENGKIIEKKMSNYPLQALQTSEYLRAFLFGRAGMKRLGGALILPGALTLFERQPVLDVGGFAADSMSEDMEIILRLHRHMRENKYPYNIKFTPAAVAWTKVPKTIHTLWAQRDRWHQGLMDSLVRHMRMFFNPRYKLVGLFSYPFYTLVEFLSAIIELAGYIAVIISMYLGILDWHFAILLFFATWGFSTILTLSTVLIGLVSFNKYKRVRDIIKILFVVALENFGYRQMLVTCRVIATLRFLFTKTRRKLFQEKSGKKEDETKAAVKA